MRPYTSESGYPVPSARNSQIHQFEPCFVSRYLTSASRGLRYARCGYVPEGPEVAITVVVRFVLVVGVEPYGCLLHSIDRGLLLGAVVLDLRRSGGELRTGVVSDGHGCMLQGLTIESLAVLV